MTSGSPAPRSRRSRIGQVGVSLAMVLALTHGEPGLAGPVSTEPAGWNQPIVATPGAWWTSSDGGGTIAGRANADFPALAHLQSAYCNPFGPATQIVGATLTRVRWHANANDMSAYLRLVAPNGSDLGVGGGLTSLLSTRRYLYGYSPEAVNLELQKDALTTDAYRFPGGQCIQGGIVFNGPGSDGVVDTAGFTPLVTNRLDAVVVEDLQGPAVANAASWPVWLTGNEAPVEWDSSDNAYRRGSTGARVAGGGQVNYGDAPNGHHGAWVPVGALGDGTHQVCGYRTAPGWAEATACATFRLDRTDPLPPVMSVSPDHAGTWGNAPVTVRASASADGTGSGWDRNQFSIDGGPWLDGPVLAIATDGDHTVDARAVDQAGRVSRPAGARRVMIDLTPPSISSASASGETGVLSWSSTDGVGFGACPTTIDLTGPGTGGGLLRVFAQASGTLPAGASVQLPIGAMPNGDYRSTLTVCDLAGNVATHEIAFTWTGNPDGGIAGAAARFVASGLTSPGARGARRVGSATVPIIRRDANRPFSVSGRLRRLDGSRFPGIAVELRDPSGRRHNATRTGTDGRFTLRARATVGGAWTVNPVGSSVRQAIAWLEVRPVVRTRIGMTAGGRAVVATGSLVPADAAGGKAVQLQWLDVATGRWRPALDGRAGPNGRFRLAYRFQRPGRYRVAMRVAVPADRGWPFLPAHSRAVTVAVG